MNPALGLELVLLRPRNPENLGAVARAMKNMALERWCLVDPGTQDFETARRVAVHAEELVDGARRAGSMAEAVQEAHWVVGTSSRAVAGLPMHEPRSFALEAAARLQSGQRVVLVFGDERSGMTNEEVRSCHALSRVPTDPSQPSINLAQTALLFAWELRMALREPPHIDPVPRVDVAQLAQLRAQLEAALGAAGFLDEASPRHAPTDLMRVFERGGLGPAEWRLWMAALGTVNRRFRSPRGP